MLAKRASQANLAGVCIEPVGNHRGGSGAKPFSHQQGGCHQHKAKGGPRSASKPRVPGSNLGRLKLKPQISATDWPISATPARRRVQLLPVEARPGPQRCSVPRTTISHHPGWMVQWDRRQTAGDRLRERISFSPGCQCDGRPGTWLAAASAARGLPTTLLHEASKLRALRRVRGPMGPLGRPS